MEKRSVSKILGVILILLGFFFIANSQANITGAVIGVSISSLINSILGIAFILVSVILFVFVKRPEYYNKELEKIIEDAKRDKDSIFVLDASGIIDYGKDLDKLLQKYKGKIYVPRQVRKEIEDPLLREKLKNAIREGAVVREKEGEVFKHYKEKSKKYMEKIRGYVIDVLEGRIPKSRIGVGYARRWINKMQFYMEERNIPQTPESLLEVLKKSKISKADVEVLATSLYEKERHNKNPKILAADLDIEYGVDEAKNDLKEVGEKIKYIFYRHYL